MAKTKKHMKKYSKKNRTTRIKGRKTKNRRDNKKRKHKRGTKKHQKKHMRGGMKSLATVPFLPPKTAVSVPKEAITKVGNQQYYYEHNNRVIENPVSINASLHEASHAKTQKGGRKSKKQHGAGDLKDIYYKAGNMISNLYSKYNGRGAVNEPPMGNYVKQPILKN
jgi:hypothetical protein